MARSRFSLKNMLSFIQHLIVGGAACFLAFLFAIQFLTPALSNDPIPPPPDYTKDPPPKTMGKSTGQFLKETGKLLKGTFSDQDPSSEKNPSPPQEKKADQGKPVKSENVDEALVEVESYMIPFIYDPINRRNPFEDPLTKRLKLKGPIVKEIIKPPTPPELFTLQQIDLKGIIWRTTESPKALIKLPDGAFYTLLRGDRIGKNGVIFEIREDEMVVLETKTKSAGSKKIQNTSITIKRMDRLGRGVRRMQL